MRRELRKERRRELLEIVGRQVCDRVGDPECADPQCCAKRF
jgi:hypothetical protein